MSENNGPPQLFSCSDKIITTKAANIKDRKSSTLKKSHSDDDLFSSNKKTIYFVDAITKAINNSKDKKLTLFDIYNWIEKNMLIEDKENHYYFNNNWKKLILQTLSTCDHFSCTPNKNFKSSLWTINSSLNLENVARKRRATSMEKEEYENCPTKRRAEMLESETSKIIDDISERMNTSATLNDTSDELKLTVEYPYIQERITNCDAMPTDKQNETLLTNNLKIERMSDVFIRTEEQYLRSTENVKNIHSSDDLITVKEVSSKSSTNVQMPCIINLTDAHNKQKYSLEFCFRSEKFGLLPTSTHQLLSNIGHQPKS